MLQYMYEVAEATTPQSHIEHYWEWSKRFGCQYARLGDASTIPVGIFGDEAKYDEGPPQKKIMSIFINFPLFRPASVRRSRFLIFAIRSELVFGTHTVYPLLWNLVRSFHYAFLGQNPDGTQLCTDGKKFLVTEIRGDLVWHKFLWRFPQRGWQSADVCFYCQAQLKPPQANLYTEIGEQAAWASTTFQNIWDWADNVLPEQICILPNKFSQFLLFLNNQPQEKKQISSLIFAS